MKNTNLDEQKKLNDEIQEHSQKGIDSFEQGLEIHKAYMDAPNERDLAEEIKAFVEKSRQGIAEMQKAIELRKVWIDHQSADIAETQIQEHNR